eukprot:2378-Heterococcus_DN1.PRE.4
MQSIQGSRLASPSISIRSKLSKAASARASTASLLTAQQQDDISSRLDGRKESWNRRPNDAADVRMSCFGKRFDTNHRASARAQQQKAGRTPLHEADTLNHVMWAPGTALRVNSA